MSELLAHIGTDAMRWAEAWCRIAREIEQADDGRLIVDEGWMVGWFANAIEAGRASESMALGGIEADQLEDRCRAFLDQQQTVLWGRSFDIKDKDGKEEAVRWFSRQIRELLSSDG
jgi:hypothetical protein